MIEAGQSDATMTKELSHPLGVAIEVSVRPGSPSRAWRINSVLLILDFSHVYDPSWVPDLQEDNKFALFQAIKFVVTFYNNNRK